jgi:aminocarboxymuconate-semialdehyde decarboxylase
MVKKRAGRVVDIHCHVYSTAAEAFVAPHLGLQPHQSGAMNECTRRVNLEHQARVRPTLTHIEMRLAEMDAAGVDIQAISTAPHQYYYWLPPDLGRGAARLLNDAIAEMASHDSKRFVGMGSVPLQETRLAVEELERCRKSLGFRGVEISSNVNGEDLASDRLRPFFAKAEALGMLVFIHPFGTAAAPERLADHYFTNTLGQPLESAIAVGHLIFGGVLDAYPDLKICVAHGGGYLPTYIGRMDHAHAAREDCRMMIEKKPSEYLRRLYFDTVVFDPEQLAYLVRRYGADHVLLGTDYPFDMGETDPVGLVERTPGLSEAERSLVCGGNAMRLLAIE